jgi:hypothetical protein
VPAKVPRPTPLVETIYDNLKGMLRDGVRAAKLLGCRALLELAVGSAAAENDPYASALALEALLRSALDTLGGGPEGRAARLLLGTASDTRGRMLKDRRRLAAMEMEVLPSTFRRNYERDILWDCAFAVAQLILDR